LLTKEAVDSTSNRIERPEIYVTELDIY
jgi:hypothetical protein